ncbi:nucleotidyltransferase family protein [bacterium]|nr:nucleotidyltransferase family protein [candidate division CSSED10-310 bacterium]
MDHSYRIILHLAAGLQIDFNDALVNALAILSEHEVIQWNRLIFPVVSTLRENGYWQRLPGPVQRRLAGKCLQLGGIKIRQMYWLKKLLTDIVPRDIPVLLLKGAALLGSVYSDHAFRVCNDIDIMVKIKDIARVSSALTEAGASQQVDFSRPFSTPRYHEVQFRLSDTNDIRLDVHLHPVPIGYFPGITAGLWSAASIHPDYPHGNILVPLPDDQIVIQAAHSLAHVAIQPHHIVDAKRVILHYRIEEDALIRRAAVFGARIMTQCMMRHLAYWFDDPVRCERLPRWRERTMQRLLPFSESEFGGYRHRTRMRQMQSMGLLDNPFNGVQILGWAAAIRLMDIVGVMLNGTSAPRKEIDV